MDDQISGALQALMMCKKKMKGEELLGHDNMKVMLQISAIKVAPGAIKQTIKLPLPAPFHGSDEVCLFVKDMKRGIRVDHEKSHRHWRDVIDNAGVTRVSEVMPLRQLKAEYSMYEAKRKLSDAYDVFLTDVRIARLLPNLLGKHFISKKKQPVAINLESSDLVAEVEAALNSTYLHIYNTGDCCTVQVGKAGQTRAELQQNVKAVVDTLKHKYPGGLQNVRSLHLKLHTSPAIPIFVSNALARDVPVPEARYQPGSRRQNVTGELSTLRADSDVTVTRHGDVMVTQKRPLSDDEELTDEEELKRARDRRRGKKFTKKAAKAAAKSTANANGPASEVAAEDGNEEKDKRSKRDEDKDETSEEDASEDEDRELEARERRFLDQLSAQESAAAGKSPAVAKAAAASAKRAKSKFVKR